MIRYYACGHHRTPDNTVGIKMPRCRTCQHKRTGAVVNHWGKLKNLPPIVEPPHTLAIANGSRDLLDAIVREHPAIVETLRAKAATYRDRPA